VLNIYEKLCDRITGKTPPGTSRSPKWREFSKAIIKAEGVCSVCTRTRGLECHHEIPFWIAQDLELEPDNVIVLCRRCHLIFGHNGNWKRLNASCSTDVIHWAAKMKGKE
jgi:5-methylcytosine-specific restriction endonuclease McrA